MKLSLVAVLLGALASIVRAADLAPTFDANQIGATFAQVEWPASLADDLKSGIENRFLILLQLKSGGYSKQVEASLYVKYDPWDEVFRVRTLIGSELRLQAELRQLSEVLAYLSKLHLPRLFAAEGIPPGQPLTLSADILINPVEREKVERLRKWVAANSAPNAIGTSQPTTLTSRRNDLFNRIFEQYVAGDELAAPWKSTLVSKPFDTRALPSGASGP